MLRHLFNALLESTTETETMPHKYYNAELLIKSPHIMSQFIMTFAWINKGIILGDSFLVDHNLVYLFDDNMNPKIKIDLQNAKVYEHIDSKPNMAYVKKYILSENNISYGLCNMIVNAVAQWIGGTPYQGSNVCNSLSMEATRELSPYGYSLELTNRHMYIRKNEKLISYAEALYDFLKPF